jgi:hypothetical protein
MLEDQLLQYGVLGLWTLFNLSLIGYYIRKDKDSDKHLVKVIENNTVAMTRVYEIVSRCDKHNS